MRIAIECEEIGIPCKVVPNLIELVDGKVKLSQIKKVDVKELLGREEVGINLKDAENCYRDKTVLITGAVGSIGSELCRQAMALKLARVIAADISENGPCELEEKMAVRQDGDRAAFEVRLMDVKDELAVDRIISRYRPQIVFHAAAYKQVPMMEMHALEVMENNFLGTRVMIDAARRYLVDRFVFISTDKAVNPRSIMGLSKQFGEKALKVAASGAPKTRFIAVRFGNVLGSSRSVIPKFKRQIRNGEPVTVTHPETVRYFMTVQEAVYLVMQATAMGTGGETKKLYEIEPAPSENQAASSQGSGFKSRASRSPAVRVSVIDPPFIPDAPVSPKPKLNMALALLLGTAGSIGIVLVMEYLDVSIKGPDNLERALGFPVLGSIPVSKSSKQDVRGIEVFSNPTSAASEAFIALRTNLQYLNFDRALKTIAITSAGFGEGKTIIACNLASALAKAGSQVVLISCDLRRPSVREVFHINGERGLSNVLAGQLSFMDVLVPIRKGLNVIAGGPVPPNPPELLGSGRMKELVEQAKRISDFVILDCPPVLPVTDAAVLSALADGFLIVAKAGSTSGISAVKAKGVLEKVSARILGAVLNFADVVSNRDYSEYGYGYYSYSKPAKEHPSGAEVTLDR